MDFFYDVIWDGPRIWHPASSPEEQAQRDAANETVLVLARYVEDLNWVRSVTRFEHFILVKGGTEVTPHRWGARTSPRHTHATHATHAAHTAHTVHTRHMLVLVVRRCRAWEG